MPPPLRRPETDAEAQARALDMLREMAELGMRAVQIAIDRIQNGTSDPDAPDPSLTLARATHAVRQALALEQRIRAGLPAAQARPTPTAPKASPTSRDPRRPHLREALCNAAAKSEPDRAARTKLCRFIEERLDAELEDDPDGAIPITKILYAIANELGLPLDPAKLSDAVLGMPPRIYPPRYETITPPPGPEPPRPEPPRDEPRHER